MSAILVPTASEAEWLERRLEGVTASEIASIMGLSPYSSPYKLYHQKLGILPADDDSDVMERGRFLEPLIAEKFGKLHPEFGVGGDGRALFAHIDRPWQMATPDRILYDAKRISGPNLAVLECKVDGGSDEWGEPGTDEIPVHYRAQALWQCRVMDVRRWYAGCFNAATWKLRVYTGVIDEAAEADLALMEGEALDFLDRLEAGDPPDVDWRPSTIAALKTMHPLEGTEDVEIPRQLVISYRAAVKNAKAAERRKDEMTARMLLAIGDGRRAIDCRTGETVATRSVSHPKRIDTERLRAEQPAIAAEYTKPPKPEVKLLPAKPKKDKSNAADSR